MLGLTWELIDFHAAELYAGEQVQRVGRRLLRRQAKTETSEAPLPLPLPLTDLCIAVEVHPRVAIQILRHSRIAVTMEIYTEVPSAATRDALKKLGQRLGS